MCRTVVLSDFSVTLREFQFENDFRWEVFFLEKRENLAEPILMQLSKKLNVSSVDFTAFLKSTFNFEYFEKKMSLIAYVFLQL